MADELEHEIEPETTEQTPAPEGSVLRMHTVRAIESGEPLSISYIVRYAPTRERRRQLLDELGHGVGVAAVDRRVRYARRVACGVGPRGW